MFGYDWASGYVSPFRDENGEGYTTPHEVVEALLDVIVRGSALLTLPDGPPLLVDLGSGDGRITLAAARRGIHALGVELDPELVASSRAVAAAEGLLGRCSFCHASLMDAELPANAALTAYLLPAAMAKLAARLNAIGHKGRLFAIRWSVEQCGVNLLDRHELSNGWKVHEYSFAPISPPMQVLPIAGRRTDDVTTLPDAQEDGSLEWQALPCDIFEDPNLVPVDCQLFELSLGAALGRVVDVVRVEPNRCAFERQVALDRTLDAGGVGADACRMTGALLWDSSVVLASYLAHHSSTLIRPRSRCLELGAGLGLVGLTAAALGHQTILTDRAECLPLLTRGIATNRLDDIARVAPLEWGDTSQVAALGQFDMVVASDCIYEVAVAPLLVATLDALCERTKLPHPVVLLSYDEAIGRPHAIAAFRACAIAHQFSWHEIILTHSDEKQDDDPRDCDVQGAHVDLPQRLGCGSGSVAYWKNSVRLVRLQRVETLE